MQRNNSIENGLKCDETNQIYNYTDDSQVK